MPEGPEIANLADELNKELHGYYLHNVDIHSEKYHQIPFHELFSDGAVSVKSVEAVGKKLIFNFNEGKKLVSFLGLSGGFQFTKGKYSHIVLHFVNHSGDKKVLYYDDKLRFGSIIICNTDACFDKAMKTTGPGFLQNQVSEGEFLDKIHSVKGSKIIVEVLVDQALFSGIGNYLRSEILYDAKVSPKRKISTLSDEELRRIYHSVMKIMRQSYHSHGRSSEYPDAYGDTGSFKTLIYREDTDPHGNKVIKEKLGSRYIYYVKEIQG